MAFETKRILLATDFQAASINAYRYCLNFAREQKLQMLIAHIYHHEAQPQFPVGTRDLESAYRKEYDAFVKRAKRFARLYPDSLDPELIMRCSVSTEVSEGDAAQQIASIAKKYGVDLVVVGAKTRPGLLARMFGNVSQHLIYDAPYPVLIVPESYRKGSPDEIGILVRHNIDAQIANAWVDNSKLLSQTKRFYLVNEGTDTFTDITPGEPGINIRFIPRADRREVCKHFRQLKVDLVLAVTPADVNGGPEEDTRRLIRYLYDHLELPLLCIPMQKAPLGESDDKARLN